MKNIKISLLIASALWMNQVHSAESSSRSGAYVGGAVGFASTHLKYNANNLGGNLANNTAVPVPSDKSVSVNAGKDKSKGIMDVFGGYGFQLGKAYVGGAVYGGFDFSGTYSTAGIKNQVLKFSRTGYFGLVARGGYLVASNTLLYLRLGVEAGRWKATSDFSAQELSPITLPLTQPDADNTRCPATPVSARPRHCHEGRGH